MSLAPVEIARLEEKRQALATIDCAVESVEIAGGAMSFGGKGSWTNQACGLGLDGPVTDAELDRLVDFYVSRGVEPKLEVCPFAHESLVLGLSRRGFTVREFENVLARTLDPAEDFRAILAHGWPTGLETELVPHEDLERVRLYADISSSGFRPESEPMSETMWDSNRRLAERDVYHLFIGRIDGEPVAAAGMDASGGVSTLFGTTVLAPYRRRGIQAALIVRRLEHATECGSTLATIHSRPGIPTERNAMRLGFRMAYTKVAMAMAGDELAPSP